MTLSLKRATSLQLKADSLTDEVNKLIKYFLASLTLPESDLWVNLSPYEKERIIPEELSSTDMGEGLLSQDYILKQLTSSLTYPENSSGKEFWQKVYKQAFQLFGKTNIPINTFNKIWITPDKAVVYEDKTQAFIGETHLKVMLEEDYLALKNREQRAENRGQKLSKKEIGQINNFSSQVMKETILPLIEKEVNQGKNFAQLRQIYYSLILATWFKRKLKESLTTNNQQLTTND